MINKNIVGYTTGVFDLFHVGHLNILKKAKENCDELIVGVTTDELSRIIKNKTPVIPYEERYEIIKSIKYVDKVIPQKEIDEMADYSKLKFDIIFKGGDWKGTTKWIKLEQEFFEIRS